MAADDVVGRAPGEAAPASRGDGSPPSRLRQLRLGSAVGLGGVLFVAAQAIVGASNVGFHVAISRLLGPADYGALGSLLAILTVVTVPATTLETLLTARIAAQV